MWQYASIQTEMPLKEISIDIHLLERFYLPDLGAN